MPKEVIWVEDCVSDVAVLKLASLKIFKDLIDLNSIGVGNCFVTIFLLSY